MEKNFFRVSDLQTLRIFKMIKCSCSPKTVHYLIYRNTVVNSPVLVLYSLKGRRRSSPLGEKFSTTIKITSNNKRMVRIWIVPRCL